MTKGKRKSNWLEKTHFFFVIIVFVMYFVVAPILLHREYKTNQEFADSLICEEKYYEQNKCEEFQQITEKSNNIIGFVILYWFFIIFIKDIWPNREKIKKFFEELGDLDDKP